MSNQHVLKIHPAPLADLLSGAKTAEVRRNDRGFQVGDTVRLMEVNPETGNWTGAADHVRTISHIQTGYGLPDGMCVLSYAQPAAGEPVAWIVVEEPFHGVQGIQSGEWDIELDAKAIESLAQDNSPGRIALFTATPPAAAHGDEAVRIKLPEFILCSDEMHERGKRAVERAIEDQCFGRWTQFKVYFEAAIEEWLSQQEDAAMRAQAGEGGE